MQISLRNLYFIIKEQYIHDGLTGFPDMAFTSITEAMRACPRDCKVMNYEQILLEISRNIKEIEK